MCTIYYGLLLDTEVLVVWIQSDRENKASWKLSMRAPTSLPGIHLPQIFLVTPNRSQPKAFQDHHFSACLRQSNSDWAKLTGKIHLYLGLPRVSIWSGRCPGGEKQPLAKCESSGPGVGIKNMCDACTLKLLISLLWPKRQSGENRLKEEIFTFGV